jgi:hypothetical protein
MGDTAAHPHGLVPLEIAATMSGRQLLQAVVAGRLPQPPIGQRLTFRLTQVGEGIATFEGDPSAARRVENCCGDAIAAVLLAAVERGVGNLHDPLGELALTGRHALESA